MKLKRSNRLIFLATILCLSVIFVFVGETSANEERTMNVTTYVDNESPKNDSDEYTHAPGEQPDPRLRSGLTVPTEGVYDKIVDTTNASGLLTAREYFYKNKRVERRTYTGTNTAVCRMNAKHLYYSDGNTIERTRTYYTGLVNCRNNDTKTYRSDKTIIGHYLYRNNDKDNIIYENRLYDVTGKHFTQKNFFRVDASQSKREIWNGTATNYIKELINFDTKSLRTNATGYRADGSREHLKTYVDGILSRYVFYADNGTTATRVVLYDEDGDKTEDRRYENGRLSRIYYYEHNPIWVSLDRLYYPNPDTPADLVQREIIFQEEGNIRDNITYFDKDSKKTRQIRYFDDGVNLRWDIDFIDGKKDSVKIYNLNFDYIETYKYHENDTELEEKFNDRSVLQNIDNDVILEKEFDEYLKNNNYIDESEDIIETSGEYIENIDYDEKQSELKEVKFTTIISAFDDELIAEYVSKKTGIQKHKKLHYEDLKIIKEVIIDNSKLEDLSGLEFLNNIEKLTINNSSITQVNDSIKYLIKIKELDMSENTISYISNNILELVNLEKINFKNNNIEDISGIFKTQINLRIINLEGNKLATFDEELINLKETGVLEKITISPNDFKILDVDFDDINLIYESNLFEVLDDTILTVKGNYLEMVFPEDSDLNYQDIVVPKFINKYYNVLNETEKNNFKVKVSYLSETPLLALTDDITVDLESIQSDFEEYNYSSNLFNELNFNSSGTYKIEFLYSSNNALNINQNIYLSVFEKNIDEIYEQEKIEYTEGDDQIASINDNIDEIELASQTELIENDKATKSLDELEIIEEKINLNNKSLASNEYYGGAYLNNNNDIILQSTNSTLSNEIITLIDENNLETIEIEEVDNSYKDLLFYSADIINEIENINKTIDMSISIDEEINGLNIFANASDIESIKNILGRKRNINNIEINYIEDDSIVTYENYSNKQTIRNGRSISCSGNDNGSLGFRGKIKYTYSQAGKVKIKTLYGATSANHLSCKFNSVMRDNSYKRNIGRIMVKNKTSDTLFIQFNKDNSPTKYVHKFSKPYQYVATPPSIVVKGAPVTTISHKRSASSNGSVVRSAKISSTTKINKTMGTADFIQHIEIQRWENGKQVWTNWGGDSGTPLILDKYYKNTKQTIRRVVGTLAGGKTNGTDCLFVKSSTIKYRLGVIPY